MLAGAVVWQWAALHKCSTSTPAAAGPWALDPPAGQPPTATSTGPPACTKPGPAAVHNSSSSQWTGRRGVCQALSFARTLVHSIQEHTVMTDDQLLLSERFCRYLEHVRVSVCVCMCAPHLWVVPGG